ncbi:dTDP-4-amino-4,6-dideoxygalactose transaminase [Amorphus suaedae]
MTDKPIYVTEPFLPPLEDFIPYLEDIWERKWLTNNGAFHQQLEAALCGYLGVEHVSLFTNGTIALVTALQAQGVSGEVITTPYSFVATAHSLVWNNLTPVFVDIDPETMNLDPAKIEAAITPRTTAILAVHCYGVPCDVVGIRQIADAHGLKVIYDAAHAFGVRFRGEGLMRHGDLSVLSFHATKVFNTFEGGAIVSPDAATKQHIDYLKNFGFADEVTVVEVGINGKMNEVQAAMGLLQLRYVDAAIARRREIHGRYCEGLRDIAGISTRPAPPETNYNYAYFPILVAPEYGHTRDALYQRLKEAGIFGRRYFYPLISTMPMYRDLPSAAPDNLPVATRVADEVICLPIYPTLANADQDRVIAAIRGAA